MKKFFILIFLLFLFPSVSANAKEVSLTLKDETVIFSAEGYTPKAECNIDEISNQITYFAIDMATSSPANLPICAPGTYQVFAKFDGNEKYASTEASAVVTITPVKAKIIANYNKVAYSRMENPINYTIEPSWAEEYIDIKIDYYPIESAESPIDNKISVPVDLGLYYTVFNATPKTSGIICENKYMLYEIAAYRGKKLSTAEREAFVPSNFSCKFQTINTVYEKDTPVTCQFTLYPAAISGDIFYRCVYADGTYSPYSKNAPIAPGEYESAYFLGSTPIGTGKIFIEKKEVAINVENSSVEYTSDGIIPTAKCEDENVDISFTAFVIDENGNVTLDEVNVPIKKCGKFSIIAYPKDTEHYKRTYAYGTIEITPATPEIIITETEFVCDGKEKNIVFSTSPSNIQYTVKYYALDDEENDVPLNTPPTNEGKYKAVIKLFDPAGNYKSIEESVLMSIIKDPHASSDDPNSQNLSKGKIALSVSVFALSCVAIAVFFLKKYNKI